MEEQLRGLRRRRRPFEGVIPHNTHAVEEDLDKKITSFSTKIDILGKIMKVYGDDVNKIPSLFKEGFLSLRTEVENDYKDIITKSQQPPLTVLANFGETLTKSNIIQAEDTIAKRSTEKRGVNDVEPTLTIDLYDQDKAWFQAHLPQLLEEQDIIEEEKDTVVEALVARGHKEQSKVKAKVKALGINNKKDVVKRVESLRHSLDELIRQGQYANEDTLVARQKRNRQIQEMIEQLEALKLSSQSIHYQQLSEAEAKEARQRERVGAPGTSLFSPVREFRVEGLDPSHRQSMQASRKQSDDEGVGINLAKALEAMPQVKGKDLEEEKEDPSLMISELPTFTSSAAMKDAATIAREVQAFMDKTTINPPNPHGGVKNQGKNKDDFDPLVRDFEAIIAEHQQRFPDDTVALVKLEKRLRKGYGIMSKTLREEAVGRADELKALIDKIRARTGEQ